MITVRHMVKLWDAKAYSKMIRELLIGRVEASLRLETELGGPTAAAAMALLRLDELAQSYVPLYQKLLNVVLSAQEADGGWSDPLTTALCIRALFACRGQGLSIDKGLVYLAQLQKPDGIWPKTPIRRLPADAFVSAFILHQLGGDSRFRATVRFADAMNWFENNELMLDAEARRLWDHASLRCRAFRGLQLDRQKMLIWS